MGKPSRRSWGSGLGLPLLIASLVAVAIVLFVVQFKRPDHAVEPPESGSPYAKFVRSQNQERSAAADLGSVPGPTPRIELEPNAKEQILSCLKGVDAFREIGSAETLSSLNDLMDKAREREEFVSERRLEYRNVHVRTPSGEELRLHFAPQALADGATERMQLKLFGVDREKLPVPKRMPSDLESLGSDEAIARFKSQGEVLLDEMSIARRYDDDTAANYVIQNGQVTRAEIYLHRNVLGCDFDGQSHRVYCRCM